ncbi:hypothetical protein KMP13_12945 [Epibacterium ulvae]|uniref:hypothetical protein n=1 Tax=Epibacterium ulvae TaxID=1156985 RepID=UPI001BFC421D|nr:hypothetical protein [Epibacterium ulvae]MBT8154775.1 hypothetical protein [Epibacterium ulvae]
MYSLSETFQNGQTFEIDADQCDTLNEALTTVVSAIEIEALFQVFAKSFCKRPVSLLSSDYKRQAK